MDWSNERYVRIYVRDTKTWKLLGWEGQAVLCLLARRFDRSGLLDDVRDAEDVALMIGSSFPVEIASVGLERILEREVMVLVESGLLWPKFLEAQESAKTDKQRQREFREKRRAEAKLNKVSQNVTNESQNVTKPSQSVTCRHGESQPVTPTSAVLCCTVPTSTEDPPITPPGGNAREKYSREFDDFRSKYPAYRRGGKLQDWKSWKIAKRAGMTADVAHEYLGYWLASPKWKNGYVVALSKWLRDGYWETRPADEEPPTNGRGVDQNEASRQRSLDALGFGVKK